MSLLPLSFVFVVYLRFAQRALRHQLALRNLDSMIVAVMRKALDLVARKGFNAYILVQRMRHTHGE